MIEASSIKEVAAGIIPATVMVRTLSEDNAKIATTLNQAFNMATKSNQQGLVNFLADRIDIHQKHAWMFRAMLKRAGATNEQVESTEVEAKTYEITFNK
jgi:DNA-binding ferritin-like protein